MEFVRRLDRVGINLMPAPDFGLVRHGAPVEGCPDMEAAQIAAIKAQGSQYGIAADVFNAESEARAFMAGLRAAAVTESAVIIAEPFHAVIEPSRVVFDAWIVLWLNRMAISECTYTNHKY